MQNRKTRWSSTTGMIFANSILWCALASLALLPTAAGAKGNPRVNDLDSRVTALEFDVDLLDAQDRLLDKQIDALEAAASVPVSRSSNTCGFADASTQGDPNEGGVLWTCMAECPAGTHVIGGACSLGIFNPSEGDVSLERDECDAGESDAAWVYSVRFKSNNLGRVMNLQATAICTDTGE